MDTYSLKRQCLYCSKELKGRKDKKFCNDGCRNTFHNDLNSPTNEIVNPIINILKKNRSIVLYLLEKDCLFVKREELLKVGFNFKYSTECIVINEDYYTFCFDVGFNENGKDLYYLFYRKEFQLPH